MFLECSTSSKANPFSVPARIIEGVQRVQVVKEDAEFFVVPYFQACMNGTLENIQNYLEKAQEYIDGRRKEAPSAEKSPRFVWIAAHDWSRCFVWMWEGPLLRKAKSDRSHPSARGEHLFTTNGDSHMNCYDPTLDVVIPPE